MASQSKTPRRGGRPTRAEASRLGEQVRAAALDLFLEHGYEDTSMDAIAQAAGTTKNSLYTRFPTKEALFRSVLAWATTRPDWPVRQPPPPATDDLELALTEIADAATRRGLHPAMIRLEQVAIAHASRYPEIARQAFGTGVWPRREFVADLLRRHAAAGAITADDPEMLAELFLGMVAAPARLASFGIVRNDAERERYVRGAVALFLRSMRL
ncbi:MAG TPA: TetR/AcrR family transcriptional regulator [Aldersonia sp.]